VVLRQQDELVREQMQRGQLQLLLQRGHYLLLHPDGPRPRLRLRHLLSIPGMDKVILSAAPVLIAESALPAGAVGCNGCMVDERCCGCAIHFSRSLGSSWLAGARFWSTRIPAAIRAARAVRARAWSARAAAA